MEPPNQIRNVISAIEQGADEPEQCGWFVLL